MVAGAVFKLIVQTPNLRRLRLLGLPFDCFNPVDSASVQPTLLLPHLDDLFISHIPSPHSIVSALLATSRHKISRLSIHYYPNPSTPPVTYRQLDFRGNLRFLSTKTDFYRTLLDPRWNALEGMKGLEEFHLQRIDPESREDGEEDLYRVIAPTLNKLVINSGDVTWFARFLPLLSRLIRLSISGIYDVPDPAPLLRCLPPSLSFLRLTTNDDLGPDIVRWTATPSLVSSGLKQIQIDYIREFTTYQQLPPVQTLGTTHRYDTLESLGRLSPGTLPFKTLEMWFQDSDLGRRSLVEAECARLGVVFRHRLQPWDA